MGWRPGGSRWQEAKEHPTKGITKRVDVIVAAIFRKEYSK